LILTSASRTLSSILVAVIAGAIVIVIMRRLGGRLSKLAASLRAGNGNYQAEARNTPGPRPV